MPSTYSPGIGIELPASGEQAGAWGTTLNNGLGYIDNAVYGGTTITLSTTPYALDISNGLPCSARNAYILFSGSPAADVTVTLGPNSYHRIFSAKNSTGKNIIFSQGSGATFTLPTGAYALIYADGAGAGAAVTAVSLSPAIGIATFAQSSTPTMDSVSRLWADANGSRYDGLSHKFDAYVSSARKTLLNLTSSGEVLETTDKVEQSGTAGSESYTGIKKAGAASASNILWQYAHQLNDKDFWIKSYNGSAYKNWLKFLHDDDLLCLTNGKLIVNALASSSSDLIQVNGGVKASSFTGSIALANLLQTAATANQAIVWSGSAWAPATMNPSMLGQQGATAGQVLSWGGSQWEPSTLSAGGVVITKSATIPVSSGAAGDVVLNSAVTAGTHAGWICLGGTTWKKFGIVDL